MTEPDPDLERRVLRNVVKQMADPEETHRGQRTMSKIVLGVGSALLLAAFFLALNDLGQVFFIAALAAMGGAAVGMGVFLEWNREQWPVTCRYIDLERVRQRLDELEDGANINGSGRPK